MQRVHKMERAAAALVADGIRLAHNDQVRIQSVTRSPLQRLVQETASNSPTAGEAKTAEVDKGFIGIDHSLCAHPRCFLACRYLCRYFLQSFLFRFCQVWRHCLHYALSPHSNRERDECIEVNAEHALCIDRNCRLCANRSKCCQRVKRSHLQ